MLTQEDDVDAHALHRLGWTISAIARHLGHDRKTIRAYLTGGRVAGQRASSAPDPFEQFAAYCAQRLIDDPHVWATTLFDEVVALGFDRSYPSFTRDLRAHRVRPHCEPCSSSKGRDHTVIEHPRGEETQWDWLELPDPPGHWGLPGGAHLLVGALPSSGGWRGYLADAEGHAHLVEGLHVVSGRLGGLSKAWRFDRMATVASPTPAGSPRRSPRSPSTTASLLNSARRGTATAKAAWRRPTTAPRSAGGARSRTSSRWPKPRHRWTRSAPARATGGSAHATA